jgi:hypothetical protein
LPPPPEVAEAEPQPPRAAADGDLGSPEERRRFWRSLFQSPRHHPAELDEPPRPSRIKPGRYQCRVSREYKLRGCAVSVAPSGHTMLEVEQGNLLGMKGVLWDQGRTVRFEGWLTEDEPFGCASCQEDCFVHPGSCACNPLPPEAIRECMKQPLRIGFGGDNRFSGELDYAVYYNQYVGEGAARRPEGYEAKRERFEVLLVPAKGR